MTITHQPSASVTTVILGSPGSAQISTAPIDKLRILDLRAKGDGGGGERKWIKFQQLSQKKKKIGWYTLEAEAKEYSVHW